MSDLAQAAPAAPSTPAETPAATAPETSEPNAFDQLFAISEAQSAKASPAPAEPGQAQPQAAPPQQPAQQAAPPAQQQAPTMVPLPELQSERAKRQESERAAQEARAEADRQKAAMDALLSRLGQVAQPVQQPQPEPQIPDPVSQPLEFAQWQETRHRAELTRVQSDMDMRFTEAKHGREAMDAAVAAAKQSGAINQFMNRPDGWSQLMQWHQRERVLQEVGTDPNAYRERVKAELLAELRGAVAPQAASQPVTQAQVPQTQRTPQIPPLLINAGPQGSAQTQQVVDNSDWFTAEFGRR